MAAPALRARHLADLSSAIRQIGGSWDGFAKRYGGGEIDLWTKRYTTRGASHTADLGDLLREHVLIRRTKAEVLTDLPAKARRAHDQPNHFECRR